MDSMGACRVCDGEIPHGHTANCDYFKQEQRIRTLETQLTALQSERDFLKQTNSDAHKIFAAEIDQLQSSKDEALVRAFVQGEEHRVGQVVSLFSNKVNERAEQEARRLLSLNQLGVKE